MTQRCLNNLSLFRSYCFSAVILCSWITYPNSAYNAQVPDKETAASATLAFGSSRYIMTVWHPLNSPYPWHTWDGTRLLSHLLKEGGFYSASARRRDRSLRVFMGYSSALRRLTLIVFEYLPRSQLTEEVPSPLLECVGLTGCDIWPIHHPHDTVALSPPQPKSIKCHEGSG